MDFSFSSYIQLIAFLILLSGVAFIRKLKTTTVPVPEPEGAWPLIGHLHLLTAKEPACKILGAIADKCGPIFSLRFGINKIVVVSGQELVKQCFTTNDVVFANRASIAAGKHMGYNNAILALAPYGQYWRDLRKLATLQLFSNHRLELLKPIILSEINIFLKDLYLDYNNNNTNAINISKMFEMLTFNISLRMVVGKRFCSSKYSDENSEAWRYKKAIEEALYLSGTFVLSDAIPWLEWVDYGGYISAMKMNSKELDTVIEAWLDEHISKKEKVNGESESESDFMDVLLSNIDEEAVMSGHSRPTVIKATSMILILTGAGSTAVTLTWILSLLLNNPKVLKAAQEEIDKQVGTSKWVEESDIQNLKYLQAIVKETLRLYPPGPLTGIREATEDCYIGKYHISKGTRLFVNLWQLHRDPQVWEDPGEFWPERFLTTHAHVDVKGQNFELIPFISGRRSCPAINFGLQLVHIALARLIQGFDLATVDGLAVDMKEGVGVDLPKVDPVEVIVKPRLGFELYNCL
ncbi:dimethylnonatriene synthase-like [Euphorbia lathyris]|uniref:dimethylnonatriene synthase-like n=1 Tax=Euphorbia lathyris TaxID=212925 RepID=UPI003313D6A3